MAGENETEEVKTEENQFNKTDFFEKRSVAEVDTASSHGWKDFDLHIKNGGDPDKWVSAEVFNERGRSIKSSMKQKSNHNRDLMEKLKGVNEVHQVHTEQLDIKIAELTEKRNEAIEDGETDKVTKLDSAIEKTKAGKAKLEASVKTVNEVPPEDIYHEAQWGKETVWFSEKTPKGAFARDVASRALHDGYHGEDLTNHIEAEVLKAFPLVNENRKKPGLSDKGNKKSYSKETLTMDSLSGDEKSVAQSLMNRGKSEKEVLEMVKNSRVK